MNKNLFLLLQGQFVSTFGTALFSLMVILYGQENFKYASVLGIVIMASQIPGAIIGPFLSGIIDRFSKKKIVIVSDFLSGLCMIVLTASLYFYEKSPTSVYIILAANTFIGLLNSILRPTILSLSADIIDQEYYQKSNSYLQGSAQIAIVAGNALGGVLYTSFGPLFLSLLNGLSYIGSGISETFIDEKKVNRTGKVKIKEIIEESIEGFKYIIENKGLRNFILISIIVNLALSPIVILLPFHVLKTLGLTSEVLGICMSAEAAGMVTGFFISSRLSYRNLILSLTGIFFLCSLALAGVGISIGFLSVICSSFMVGCCIGLINVPLLSILQKIPPENMRGRIIGTFFNIITVIAPIGIGLVSILLDLLSNNTTFIFFICSGILILSGILTYTNDALKKCLIANHS